MQSSTLKNFLKENAESCNHQVRLAQHQYDAFDVDSFKDYLLTILDPALAKHFDQDQQCGAVHFAEAGFQIGLQMTAMHWFADNVKSKAAQGVWNELLPLVAPLTQARASLWVERLFNVVDHTLHESESHFNRWLKTLSAVVQQCQQEYHLEYCVLVCAWLAGLSQYREAALKSLSQLPSRLQQELAVGAQLASVDALFERWGRLNDHWAFFKTPSCQLQARIGEAAFLGGDFSEPPQAYLHQQSVYVHSGGKQWLLHTDRFGTTLTASSPSHDGIPAPDLSRSRKLVAEKVLRQQAQLNDFPELYLDVLNDDVAVFSSPFSFSLIVFALGA